MFAEVAGPTCARDVPALFGALASSVPPELYLGARNDGVIPWPRYTDSIANRMGVGEHFQGIARTGRHAIVSAGVMHGPPTSQLVVIEMEDRGAAVRLAPARAGDRVAAVIDVDPALWHAGGIQIAHDVLAVALFGDDPVSGELRFFDVADPTAPREIAGARVARARKLYAAGLARLDDGRWLALAWDDEHLELLRSRGADLAGGFDDDALFIEPGDVAGGFQGGGCGLGCGTYQSVNLLRDCNGELFAVGTRNEQKAAPAIPGPDIAGLYRLTLGSSAASLALVEHRTFTCADQQCNFAAAAGIHLIDEHQLVLYSAYHWLRNDGARLLFNEL